MEIRIKSSEELKKLLDTLAAEIADANIYHRLYKNLIDSIRDYASEFSQSNTFWSLTLDALNDARLVRLCRVLDQEGKGLNLFNLLKTIKANIPFFDKKHFKERLKSNSFVDSLAENNRIPERKQLEKDLEFAGGQNPLVRKLMIWRNNIIAHRGSKVALGRNEILINNPLSEEELSKLLDECFRIVNQYSSLYHATTYSRNIVGHDDYKSLLKFIKMGLQKRREDIDKEVQKIKRRQSAAKKSDLK